MKYCTYCGSKLRYKTEYEFSHYQQETGKKIRCVVQKLVCPSVTWFSSFFSTHQPSSFPYGGYISRTLRREQ